jgi:hypothetical protein
MRAWNCFSTQLYKNPQIGDKVKAPKGAWRKFKPYSNALWIYYIFDFLVTNYKGGESLDRFLGETKELRRRLDPDTPRWRSAFDSACDVLEFCEEEGWITQAESLNPAAIDGGDNNAGAVDGESAEASHGHSTERASGSDSGSKAPCKACGKT